MSSLVSALFASVFSAATLASTSVSATPEGNPFPLGDNVWHVGYDVPGYSSAGSFEEIRRGMGDQSADHPMEVNEVIEDLDNKMVLQSPTTGCINTGPPQTNSCAFTASSATQLDDHHIRIAFKNWGGRCEIFARVMKYPKTLAWRWGPDTPWAIGSPFIVIVPGAGSDRHPYVFGRLNGGNVFFDPEQLAANDPVELIKKETVPGLGDVYRFRLK